MSPLGAQRAAGFPWIITVTDPSAMGGGGAGGTGGGWTMPNESAPEHTQQQPTCAAGIPSMRTGFARHMGQGTDSAGPMAPDGTSKSCVTGSPIRAAGKPGMKTSSENSYAPWLSVSSRT
jgi:hypothetical protein